MPFTIAIIGDFWREQDAFQRRPFVGPDGQELTRMLADAGVPEELCFKSTVFACPVPRNDLETICVPKSDPEADTNRGAGLVPGKYLRREYTSQVDRLLAELDNLRPNVAVLLGNAACWALLGQTRVSKLRGAVAYSSVLPWLKCLPTYHPAAVLRQYDLRHVAVMDLTKAKVESAFPEIRRPKRESWIEPTIEDIRLFKAQFIDGAQRLAFDIETADGQITCIGFASTIDRALVIPFVDPRKTAGNYWPTLQLEIVAWALVAEILSGPQEMVAQNGLYDIQYLWMKYGIPVPNSVHDTMLLHHSLLPESEKSLGFLGSVYTNEGSWKEDHARGKHTIKRED